MSDFDKEAERQRLREKYEAEREDRESTQRMSELLLKGATMTNKHCGNCGDPIFRYDGQEFCPSCSASQQANAGTAQQGDVDAANADAANADAANATGADVAGADADADATANAAGDIANAAGDVANADGDVANADGDVDAATNDATSPSASATDSVEVTNEPTPTPSTTQDATTGSAPTNHDAAATTSTSNRSTTTTSDPVSVDETAIENVEATLERFAAAANSTDDPERAREYLAVVRDATDTLRTLRARQ